MEHDSILYEDAGQMTECIAQALKQTSREATIPLYSPALDPQLQKITEPVDRMFCIYEGENSDERTGKGRGEDARRPEIAEGILTRWP